MPDNTPALYQGRPVADFPIEFAWHAEKFPDLPFGWMDIFDKQVALIQQDIERARFSERLIVYLSCPISSRGGGFFSTNVDVAVHTQIRLLREWGEGIWILNPSQYQLESKQGVGLLDLHVKELCAEFKINTPVDVKQLLQTQPVPGGGDYMRMWTRVLVEAPASDNPAVMSDRGTTGQINMGGRFDAFYFLGPNDVRDFFLEGGASTVTAGIEAYFARKFAFDSGFRNNFTPVAAADTPQEASAGQRMRQDFFRYYALRASTTFSSGSHDEWNIWQTLNRLRVKKLGIGSQIAGFFDGRQIDIGGSETQVSPGYATKTL